MAKRERPSVERLRELLEYDPETGELRWKVRRSNQLQAGDEAGSINGDGYRIVKVDRYNALVHRVAWALQTGEWPPDNAQIDHKDMDRSNNRWDNLRMASQSHNQWNRTAYRNNTSGYKGVYYFKNRRKWLSKIQRHGKEHFLGYFDTPEEAHAAYCKAANDLHGDFARVA